jgi:hypothetical protein
MKFNGSSINSYINQWNSTDQWCKPKRVRTKGQVSWLALGGFATFVTLFFHPSFHSFFTFLFIPFPRSLFHLYSISCTFLWLRSFSPCWALSLLCLWISHRLIPNLPSLGQAVLVLKILWRLSLFSISLIVSCNLDCLIDYSIHLILLLIFLSFLVVVYSSF